MKQRKAILLILLALTTYVLAACPEHCDECDDSGSICFACQGDYEVNVFGGCHPNTISKCVIYGPTDQCFRCQPTYTIVDGKCERSYTGCVNEGGVNECFECAFGTTLDGQKCKGVINCADFDGKKCNKCKEGYTLNAGICKDSSTSCAEVRPADGTCSKCKQGFFQSGYRCFENKYKNDRCYVLTDNSKCGFCKGGYNDVEGKCLLNKEMTNSGQPGGFDSFGSSSSGSFGDQSSSSGFSQDSFSSSSTTTTTTTSDFSHNSGSFDSGFSSFDGGSNGGSFNSGGFNSQPAAPAVENCEVPDPNGGCVVCVYGYFPSKSKCQLVSELCDGHNVQTGDCFACKNELTLESGKCVDKKCSSWKVNKCQTCVTGFKVNEKGVCKQFDPNCVDSSNGRCQKCKPEFYIDISGKCKNLPPNCAAANMQTGACLECVKDYEILTAGAPCTKKIVIENCQVVDTKNVGKCLICNSGYFPEGTKCSKVSELCKDYNGQNGKCTSCISAGFTLTDGKCVDPNCATKNGDTCSACSPRFELNKAEKICKLVDPNCKNLAIASCLECKGGFYISNQKICKALPANCLTADPAAVCLTCASGFEIYRGTCIKTVVIPNCASVDSPNNKCLACNDRYFLSGAGCAAVSISCNTYNSNNGWCLTCKLSNMFVQADGTCAVPPPPPAPAVTVAPTSSTTSGQTSGSTTVIITKPISVPSTLPVNPPSNNNQQTASQSTGQSNQNTQGSAQTTSVNGATVQGSDLNCREYNGPRCLRCSTRYYVNQETNRCVPVNPLCKDSNSAGECTQCYQGYKVEFGKCIISQSNDVNCKTPSGAQCSECYQGYFYSQADRICKRVNPLCKSSNSANGFCTACYPGYALNNANGNCEVSFKDPNCKQFRSDGSCRLCSSRYFVNSNGKCSAANPLCKQYNPNNGSCTSCYPGYGLTLDGQCQAGISQDNNCKSLQGTSCRQCVSGYFLGQEGKCKQASPLCKTFDKFSGNCLTCYNGYEVSNGACIIAKSQDPHCKKSDDNNQCISCYQGYIAIQGKCKQQNPLCKGVDMSNGGCTGCWPGYTLIDSNCVVEKSLPINSDPYCLKIEGGLCTKCSSGYFYHKGQGLCAQLDPICKASDMNNGDCTDCYNGYKLSNGKCNPADAVQIVNCLTVVNGQCQECIEGTYMSNGECKQVSILCASYDKSNGDCTSCISGHFLQEGVCIFPAIFDQNCVRYESAYCSRCRIGFYLSNFMCAPVDANCSNFDYSTSTCVSCANGLYPNGSNCQNNNY